MLVYDFFMNGVEGRLAEYRRSSHPEEKISIIWGSHQYNGVIERSFTDSTRKIERLVIDGTIEIEMPSEELHREARATWLYLKRVSDLTYYGLFAALFAGCACVAGVLYAILPAVLFTPALIVAAPSLKICILVGSLFIVFRISDYSAVAAAELALWPEDPAAIHQGRRTDLRLHGLASMRNKPELERYASRDEKQKLWQSLCQVWIDDALRLESRGATEAEKGKFVEELFEKSPFMKRTKLWSIAFSSSEEVPEAMERERHIVEALKAWGSQYSQIALSFLELKIALSFLELKSDSSKKRLASLDAAEKRYEAVSSQRWIEPDPIGRNAEVYNLINGIGQLSQVNDYSQAVDHAIQEGRKREAWIDQTLHERLAPLFEPICKFFRTVGSS